MEKKLEFIGHSDGSYNIYGDNPNGTARLVGTIVGGTIDENLANAKLFCDAPALLEALLQARNILSSKGMFRGQPELYDIFKKALGI